MKKFSVIATNDIQNVGHAINELHKWRDKWNYNEPIDVVRTKSYTCYVIFYRLQINQAIKRFTVPRDNNKVRGKQDAIKAFHDYRKKNRYWDKIYILDVQKHKTYDIFYQVGDMAQTRLD